nr:TonB-dependent receptor [Sphingomonas tagetis]
MLCVIGSEPARAQDAPAAAADEPVQGIQEIIVTAERREQSIQRAPITIAVVGGEEGAKAGLSKVEDLTRLVTGMQIGAGGGNAQIYVRGVGDFSYSSLSNPGVAFNVDGVYVGRTDGMNGNFFDVERVEVLKGPQGTLYGRNSNGGSINLITKDPSFTGISGYVSGELGNYDLKSVAGALNLPLGETVAARIAFKLTDRDGYLSDGSLDDVKQSVRFKLRFQPSSDVSLRLSADYTHLGGVGGGYVLLPSRPGSDPWEGTADPAAIAYRDTFPGTSGPLAASDLTQDTTLWNLSAQLDWDLGFADLTILPAYRNVDTFSVGAPGFFYQSTLQAEQESLEVRLGNSSPGLTWVIGAFAYHDKIDGLNFIKASTVRSIRRNFYFPETKAGAVFGQATFGVTDGLRLIAGLRYTTENRTLTGRIVDARATPEVTLVNFGGERDFDGWTYKGGFEYDVAPQSMLYFTASKGFKAGGLNQTGVASRSVFEPEMLNAYELGMKNRLFDNRLQLNLSAFYWKYKDIQNQNVEIVPVEGPNFLFSNVGDATLFGGTIDAIFKPTSFDTFTASVEYTNSEYDSYAVTAPTIAYNPATNGCPVVDTSGGIVTKSCAGFQVARAPEWSGSASYQHVFDFGSSGQLAFVGSMQFSSARWIGVNFLPAERDPAYAIFNASLDYTSDDGRFSVGAFIRNIGKTAYITGGIQHPFRTGLIGANISEPRVFGVRASFKFGEE